MANTEHPLYIDGTKLQRVKQNGTTQVRLCIYSFTKIKY